MCKDCAKHNSKGNSDTKSELTKILEEHSKPEDNDGNYSAFIRALASGSIRLAEGAQVDGATAINIIRLRPDIFAKKSSDGNELKKD